MKMSKRKYCGMNLETSGNVKIVKSLFTYLVERLQMLKEAS